MKNRKNFETSTRICGNFWPKDLFFWSSSFSLDPHWNKFLVPPCSSRIHINKFLVPPKNLFLLSPPPSHAILAPGLNRWLSLLYLNKGLNKVLSNSIIYRGGSRGHKARRQGQGHRHKKKFEARAKAKNSPSEDRHSRGQGQECSRPRPRTKDTNVSVLKKKKEQKFFQAISKQSGVEKIFSADLQNFNHSKNSAVL